VEKLSGLPDSVYSLPDLQRITAKHDTHRKVVRVYFQTLWARLLTLYWLISIWNLLYLSLFYVLLLKFDVWSWSTGCDAFDSHSEEMAMCYVHVAWTCISSNYNPSFWDEVPGFAGLPQSIWLFITSMENTSLYETDIFSIKHAN
jgi:hypothetical protein